MHCPLHRTALVAALTSSLALAGGSGSAEPAAARASVQLEYARLEGADRCPDARRLRDAIASHLGYDPVSDSAESTIVTTVRRGGEGLIAEIHLHDASGKTTGSRSLSSSALDCRELAQSVALAVSIAIDPLRAERPSRPKEKPQPEPTPAPTPEAPPRVITLPGPLNGRPPEPPPEPWRLLVGAGALVSQGTAPASAVGFALGAGMRSRSLSLSLEGRADLPAEKRADSGTVSTSLLLATLVPCYGYGAFWLCALGSGGALQGSGSGVDVPRKATTFYGAAGGRIGFELRARPWLGLELFGDLRGTLTRTTLSIGGRDAWTTPALSGALGVMGLIGEAP